MRIYATVEDITEEWLPSDVLKGLEVSSVNGLLRSASLLVEQATRLDYYATDKAGMPTDPVIAEAFKNAVLQQVTTWANSGLDPNKGVAGQKSQIASQSASAGSVSYAGAYSAQELGRLASELDGLALQFLLQAGLCRAQAVYKP